MKRILIVAILVLTGCGTAPKPIVQQPMTARPHGATAAQPKNGAIFQNASYRPLFEDRRARMVGDILTIAIAEKTSAAKSNAVSGSKDGSTSNGVSSLFAVPATTTAKMGLSTNSANEFSEKGAASSSNSFTGTIGVTVIDVLPNGNLVVSGEKQIAFDKGAEYVRFSGIVNPDTIGAGNAVSSTQVADVKLEYKSNSRLDRAEVMSQLARFFFSILPI
jgi:flagellar L-ring protein precursor FlgH